MQNQILTMIQSPVECIQGCSMSYENFKKAKRITLSDGTVYPDDFIINVKMLVDNNFFSASPNQTISIVL